MDPLPKKSQLKKQKAAYKRAKSSDSEDLFESSSSQHQKKKENKQKLVTESKNDSSTATGVPHCYKLGVDKKRVSVGSFKGMLLINLREYYQKDGEWLPTKTGITLTTDQWQKLKELIPKIDKSIGQVESKK